MALIDVPAADPIDPADPAVTAMLHGSMPFTAELGVEGLSGSSEEVRTRLAWAPRLCTAGDALHGGALMSLADATGGLCAHLNLPAGARGTTTIESKTNFLRPLVRGHVTATARPLHRGRRVIVVETELRDDEDVLLAKVTQTQAVLSPPER